MSMYYLINNSMASSNNTITKDNIIDWTIKIASFVMSIAIMVSSFFLTKAWEKITNLEKDVSQLKIDYSVASSTQLTYKQWIDAKSIIDSERVALDKRLIKIEETYPMINNSIMEIKQSINRLEDNDRRHDNE